jgi:hypothetical protein
MASRRQRHDPLRATDNARWLARLDEHGRVQTSQELAPGADLRQALAQHLNQLALQGWRIEGVAFSGSFVRKGSDRHYVSIYPHNPHEQFISLHGPYPGSRTKS